MATKGRVHSPYVASGPAHTLPYTRQQTRALHTGSSAWARIRAAVLLRDAYICAACGTYGNEVDHIDGNSHNNEGGNLQTLCKACHATKTRKEQNGRRANH